MPGKLPDKGLVSPPHRQFWTRLSNQSRSSSFTLRPTRSSVFGASLAPRSPFFPRFAHSTERVNPEDPGYPIPYTPFPRTQPVMMRHPLKQAMSAMMLPVQGLAFFNGSADNDEKSKSSGIEDSKAIMADLQEKVKILQEGVKSLHEQEETRRRQDEIAKVREETKKATEEECEKRFKEESEKRHKAEVDKEEALTKLESLEIAMEVKNKPAPDVGEAPIKFKDAARNKYIFPFHLCKTWEGMEGLMEDAFAQDDVIRRQISQGQYRLMGPDGDIIIPRVWESTIQPGWEISLQMGREPEEAKTKPASRSRTNAGSSRRLRSTYSHARHRQQKSGWFVM